MLAQPPVVIEGGDGFIEATLRRGGDGSVLLHLTNWASGPRPAASAIPLGPLQVNVRLPFDMTPTRVQGACRGRDLDFTFQDGIARFGLDRLEEYEMVRMG